MIVCCQLSLDSNQSTTAIVQLQCRINERVRNAILSELRAYGANNYSLWFRPLNNETANHHVLACLNKRARGGVACRCGGHSRILKCANVRNSHTAISALVLGWRSGITPIDSQAAGLKSMS